MWLKYLTVSAVCAALLGLAASGLVRRHVATLAAMEKLPAEPEGNASSAAEEAATPEEHRRSPLVGPAAKERATPSRRRAPSRPRSRDGLSQDLNRGIRKLGEHRYELKQSAVELALANLALLPQWIRIGPDVRAGKALGFRILAVATDGPFAKLGLQEDDVLVSVNGLDIRTADHALEAFGQLKSARHLVLGFLRGQQAMNDEYAIR